MNEDKNVLLEKIIFNYIEIDKCILDMNRKKEFINTLIVKYMKKNQQGVYENKYFKAIREDDTVIITLNEEKEEV